MKNYLVKTFLTTLLVTFWVCFFLLLLSKSTILGCIYLVFLFVSIVRSKIMIQNLKKGIKLIKMDSKDTDTKVNSIVSKVSDEVDIFEPDVIIVNDRRILAHSLKNKIYISTGAIKELTTDELKYVVAHEIGHIDKQNFYYSFIVDFIGGVSINIMNWGVNRNTKINFVLFLIMFPLVSITFLFIVIISRHREYMCDKYAVRVLNKKEPMESFMDKFENERGSIMYPSKSKRLKNIQKL